MAFRLPLGARLVRFPTADGLSLEGRLVPGDPARGVVLCHPHPLYGGSMLTPVILTAEQAFREAGHTTLLFNFRGVGASEGTHGEGRTEVADVAGALAFLRRSLGAPDKVAGGGKTGAPAAGTGPGGARGPDGLGAGAAAPSGGPPALAVAGYSFGSYVGARAAAADPGVGFYLGIAPVTSRYDYGVLAGFRGRLALIGGTRDEFGPRDQLEALAARLPGPPWLRILDADHFFEGAMPELAAACREAIAVAA